MAVTSPTLLAEGDLILIGETQLQVVRPGAAPGERARKHPPPCMSAKPSACLAKHPPPAAAAACRGFALSAAPSTPRAAEPAAPPPPTPIPAPAPAPDPFPPLQVSPAAVQPAAAPPTPRPSAREPPAPAAAPEVPPRWFVPPPPPVARRQVIPPPPAEPRACEAPPSGAPLPPTPPKPSQCARCHEALAPGDLVCMHCGQGWATGGGHSPPPCRKLWRCAPNASPPSASAPIFAAPAELN